MPHYKLTYFNIKGLGEHIRLIFIVSGTEFDEKRIEFSEWSLDLKSNFKLGQLPILEVDGKQLTQSLTIGRFLGKRFNLVPDDDWRCAKADEIIDIATEVRLEFKKWALVQSKSWQPDEVKAAEALKNLKEEIFPKYLPILENEVNETIGPFIAGNRLIWRDLFLATWLQIWEDLIIGKNGLDNYPGLKGLKNAVYDVPVIKDYIAKRQDMWV